MRKLYIWLSFILGLGLFFFVINQVSWVDAMKVLRSGRLDYLLVYIAVSVIIRIILSWRWHIILKAKNIHVPFHHNIAYRTAGFAISFISPGPRVGGEFMTAGLVTRHNKKVRYSKALSTLAIDRAVEVQTFAAMFFLGVLVLAALGDIPSGLRVLLIGTSTLLLVLMVIFGRNVQQGKPLFTRLAAKYSKNPKFKKGIKHFEQTVVSFYREDRKNFYYSHLVSAADWLLALVEYKYLLLFLGFNVPLYGVFIVYSFVGLAYILPVPLAIGTLEGGQVAAFNLIGLSTTGGFILALATRLRDIAFTIIGFMILLYYGIAPATAASTVRK